jgi:hypothetical protein
LLTSPPPSNVPGETIVITHPGTNTKALVHPSVTYRLAIEQVRFCPSCHHVAVREPPFLFGAWLVHTQGITYGPKLFLHVRTMSAPPFLRAAPRQPAWAASGRRRRPLYPQRRPGTRRGECRIALRASISCNACMRMGDLDALSVLSREERRAPQMDRKLFSEVRVQSRVTITHQILTPSLNANS